MVTKILIVDDSTTDLLIIQNMLSDYDVIIARNGNQALAILDEDPSIHLVILDLNMPFMDGFEVLEHLKKDYKYEHIRVIILTNLDEIENEIRGLELGAVDYIRKPVNLKALKIRIEIHKKLLNLQHDIEDANYVLDQRIEKATKELVVTRDITIHALVGLIEARNLEAYNHIMRTKQMMVCLCQHLSKRPKYYDVLTEDHITELVRTSPLHDIGKVAIPDHILLKPGKLDKDEFELMKKHVEYGVSALKKELSFDVEVPSFIHTAIEIVGTHHEKWDGSGYPNGLKGEMIPLAGRLMAIIDVFDALINERVYKKAYSLETAIKIIEEGIGTHFDPEIANAFLEIIDQVVSINKQYSQT